MYDKVRVSKTIVFYLVGGEGPFILEIITHVEVLSVNHIVPGIRGFDI